MFPRFLFPAPTALCLPVHQGMPLSRVSLDSPMHNAFPRNIGVLIAPSMVVVLWSVRVSGLFSVPPLHSLSSQTPTCKSTNIFAQHPFDHENKAINRCVSASESNPFTTSAAFLKSRYCLVDAFAEATIQLVEQRLFTQPRASQ